MTMAMEVPAAPAVALGPTPVDAGPGRRRSRSKPRGTTGEGARELSSLKVSCYEMLIRQLQDDGFVGEAQSLAQRLHIQPNAQVEKDALVESYGKSLKYAFGDEPQGNWVHLHCSPVPPLTADEQVLDLSAAAATRHKTSDDPSKGDAPAPGGLEAQMPAQVHPSIAPVAPVADAGNLGLAAARKAPEVRLTYTAQHKSACRSLTFSNDGRFVATGYLDGSIKILDTAKMAACGVSTAGPLGRMRITEDELQKPIVRTLHDHMLGISCLAFHPTNPTLFSGGTDKAVKIFDLTRPPGHKKAFSVLQDVHPVRSICIHPCGDFLFVATAHQAVRLYDLQTLNCFTTFDQSHHHQSGVNDVRCTSDGRVFCTGSSDGSIQLWDAVSHRAVNRLPKAHSGASVQSVRWGRALNYILSSGCDGRHRIWDVRMGKEVFCMGFGPRSCEYSTAVFCQGEKYIATANSNTQASDVSIFDAATGSPVFMKMGMHPLGVRTLEASPIDKTLMTGCDDQAARYFSVEEQAVVPT